MKKKEERFQKFGGLRLFDVPYMCREASFDLFIVLLNTYQIGQCEFILLWLTLIFTVICTLFDEFLFLDHYRVWAFFGNPKEVVYKSSRNASMSIPFSVNFQGLLLLYYASYRCLSNVFYCCEFLSPLWGNWCNINKMWILLYFCDF